MENEELFEKIDSAFEAQKAFAEYWIDQVGDDNVEFPDMNEWFMEIFQSPCNTVRVTIPLKDCPEWFAEDLKASGAYREGLVSFIEEAVVVSFDLSLEIASILDSPDIEYFTKEVIEIANEYGFDTPSLQPLIDLYEYERDNYDSIFNDDVFEL